MAAFLAEVAAQAGWAIPVAAVLWFITRRLTTVECSTESAAASVERVERPAWQRALGLVAAAALVLAFTIALGWLITRVLAPVRELDIAIMAWFGAHRTEAATVVAFAVDQIGNTPGIIAMVIIAAAVAHAMSRRWAPALVIVVAAAGETSIFLLAQLAISRARPDIERLAGEPATSSFPSGHVAATIVTYGCIALLAMSWTLHPLRVVAVVIAITLGLAMAWVRLYQGMHFPSDVLASFVFASLWLAACWWAFRPGARGERVRGRRATQSQE
ncbi:phosphatase PAP2 family protein [Microcella sp.]|uniref:phosphatase PAP2 family protein n=1 Tax=Microcella sp. TaxID=1913979 RepID=UPI00256BAD41|nr:phosphatase PAP2 family protein [Microcella sp.]MBX9471653.1 phosphatase PAP2 family protein [Microcella sp.]